MTTRPVIGVGTPVDIERKGPWIKQFPGGQGENNCPRFWYIRDGFGCIFKCRYCYLKRFGGRRPGPVDPRRHRPPLRRERTWEN